MRPLCLFCVMLLALSSCRDKVICPAFQSTYILDDSVRQTYFSYLWKIDESERQAYLAKEKQSKDSIENYASGNPSQEYFAYVASYVPPTEDVKKNKYGIQKYEPFWLKNIRLRTAPMENVLAPDFNKDPEEVDEGQFLASDFNSDTLSAEASIDTTAVAGVPSAIQKDTEKEKGSKYRFKYEEDDGFNMEQVYYNKYFGEQFLIPPKPKIPPQAVPDSLQSQEKVGFFKRLFRKKKQSADTVDITGQSEEDTELLLDENAEEEIPNLLSPDEDEDSLETKPEDSH